MKIKEQVITSRANPLVLAVAGLEKKRERDKRGLFCCDGKKLCFEYIKNCGAPLHLFVNEKNSGTLLPELEMAERVCGVELEVTLTGDGAFSKMTEQKAPDGIICVGEKEKLAHERVSEFEGNFDGERIIMLDSLRDTGNVGTVIRTALAFGFDRVVLSSDCADIYSAKTLRASMGAIFCMKITVTDSLCDAVHYFTEHGRRVFAAELRDNAVSLDDTDIRESDIFIIGNEGHGIEDEVSALCRKSVYIPISERSESLNAAVAASVIMWHQRMSFM